MTFRWESVTVDCADPAALSSFWVELLGGDITEPLPGWRRIVTPSDALPNLTFQPVPEPKRGKTRIHLDLVVDDHEFAQYMITKLGGRPLGRRHEYPEGIVVEMADPEGNEFCVTQYM